MSVWFRKNAQNLLSLRRQHNLQRGEIWRENFVWVWKKILFLFLYMNSDDMHIIKVHIKLTNEIHKSFTSWRCRFGWMVAMFLKSICKIRFWRSSKYSTFGWRFSDHSSCRNYTGKWQSLVFIEVLRYLNRNRWCGDSAFRLWMGRRLTHRHGAMRWTYFVCNESSNCLLRWQITPRFWWIVQIVHTLFEGQYCSWAVEKLWLRRPLSPVQLRLWTARTLEKITWWGSWWFQKF